KQQRGAGSGNRGQTWQRCLWALLTDSSHEFSSPIGLDEVAPQIGCGMVAHRRNKADAWNFNESAFISQVSNGTE
ncbi:MAG TPA: hypothetical protein VFV17_06475, partial [Usitatibacteraceae bacterium]|nr:hypothetical protein [Usitatibacteraceae bacterium]